MYPLDHAGAIRSSARRNGLDPALVAAVVYAESRFDEQARSSQGAVGLMQVLPDTADQIARESGGVAFTTADLEDPAVNVRYGCYYLRGALDAFDGDVVAAVASYNAGMGAVAEWRAEAADEGHGCASTTSRTRRRGPTSGRSFGRGGYTVRCTATA